MGIRLRDNNGGSGRELVIENIGTGARCLLFDDNVSLNTVPAGQFNFDFKNTGDGEFDLVIFSVDKNTGKVGSSDGSVIVP